MNYQKLYDNIINNAKSQNRIKLKRDNPNYVYYEKHHIVPRCLNGSDDKNNLVLLTAREHFICHKLLTFIYPKNRKLKYTLCFFVFNKNYNLKISSKDYEYFRKLTPILKGIDNGMFGKHHKYSSKIKISNTRKIKNIAKGTKNPMYSKGYKITGNKNGMYKNGEKIKGDKNGMRIHKPSLEYREKIRQARLNTKLSDYTKQKISLSNKGKNNGMFGKIFINDDNINKVVSKKELLLWINKGWKKGLLKRKNNL